MSTHPGFTFDLSLEAVQGNVRRHAYDAVLPCWKIFLQLFKGTLEPPRRRDDNADIRMLD